MTEEERQYEAHLFKWGMIENCFTLIACAATIITIFYLSGSLHAFWGLLLLVNLNTIRTKKLDD